MMILSYHPPAIAANQLLQYIGCSSNHRAAAAAYGSGVSSLRGKATDFCQESQNCVIRGKITRILKDNLKEFFQI